MDGLLALTAGRNLGQRRGWQAVSNLGKLRPVTGQRGSHRPYALPDTCPPCVSVVLSRVGTTADVLLQSTKC